MSLMRDPEHNLSKVRAFDPDDAATADITGDTIDRLGTNGLAKSANFVIDVGASGDTLDADNHIDLILQHGDESNGSDMVDVTEVKDVLDRTLADEDNGIFALINAANEDDAIYEVTYVGPKRYCRVYVDFVGTHNNGTPVQGIVILSPSGRFVGTANPMNLTSNPGAPQTEPS